jgi:excisionase family DNA binding protein
MTENAQPRDKKVEPLLPLLLSFEAARQQLGGVSVRHLYNLIARGELTRVKLGRAAKITAESVRKLAMGK